MDDDAPIFESSEPMLEAPPAPAAGPSPPDPLYRILLDNLVDGVLACDADGNVTYTNHAMRTLHGLDDDTPFEQANVLQDLWDASGSRPLKHDELPTQRVLRGEAIENMEIVVRRPGRPRVCLAVRGQRILDRRGRVRGAVVTVRDVTAHKNALKALQHSQSLLAEAEAIADIGSWEWDMATDELTWTEETYRLYSVPLHTAVRYQDWFGRIVPEEQPRVQQVIEQAKRDHQPFCIEHDILGPTGERRTMNSRGRVIVNEAGQAVYMRGTAQDITERKRYLEALRERTAQLDEAQRIAHMGSWTWDIPHARVSGSEEYFRIFGQPTDTGSWPIEAVVAQVHPEDRPLLASLLERAKHDPSPFTFSFRIVRKDGQVRFLQAQGYPKTYDGDRPLQFFGTVQDVTEAQEVERAKDEFLSVASHELRTPLTSIRAPLLMLAAGKIDPQTPLGRNLLELAVANTERMTRLVNDIMDMERLARGRLSLKPEPVDGRMLAMEAAASLETDAQSAGVTVGIEGPAAPFTADPQRVVQVLTNLLDNAIDFSPRDGRVRVTLAVTDGWVRFGVHDQGPGIPPDQLETIFNRFKQLEPSATRKKQGLGLGLPISRAIAEQHGGRLWAESPPGEGATFWLELPVNRPA